MVGEVMRMNGGGYEDVGMMTGIMEIEGWNGRNVCKGLCGNAWPCRRVGHGFNGY